MKASKSIPRISEAEWEVLQALWRQSPKTAAQIVDEVNGHPKTIKTYLSRLVSKGVIGFDQEGRKYSYFPKVSEQECQRSVSRDFVNRIFGGTLKPMLAQFVEGRELSQKEIDELKAILDEGSQQ